MKRWGLVCLLMVLVTMSRLAANTAPRRVIGSIQIGSHLISAYSTGECVEFADRVTQAMGDPLVHLGANGVASEFYDLAATGSMSQSWLARPNGGLDSPEIWDCIVWKGGTDQAGHIAVVKTTDTAHGRIEVVEQNWSHTDGDVWLPIQVKNDRYTLPKRGSYQALGWIHPLFGIRPQPGLQVLMEAPFALKRKQSFTWGYPVRPESGSDVYVNATTQGAIIVDLLDQSGRVLATGYGNRPFSFRLPKRDTGDFVSVRITAGPVNDPSGWIQVSSSQFGVIYVSRWQFIGQQIELVIENVSPDGAGTNEFSAVCESLVPWSPDSFDAPTIYQQGSVWIVRIPWSTSVMYGVDIMSPDGDEAIFTPNV
jgi:hypothetical protein